MNRFFALLIAGAAVCLESGCGGGGKNADADVNRWLDLEIERPESEVPEKVVFERDYEEPDENGMITNTYLVHPAAMRVPLVPESDNSGAAPDPFAPPEPESFLRIPRKANPIRALGFYGVKFTPGSSATYNQKNYSLRVTLPPDQMDLVEAVIGSILICTESGILFRCEVFELGAADALELEKSASEHFDHAAERKAVIDLVRKGGARIVTTANLPARSGQRANYEDSREIRFVSGFKWEGEGENRVLVPDMRVMQAGTLIEVDPVLGPDDVTIDLQIAIDHQLGPPVLRKSEMSIPGADVPAVVESPVVSFGSIKVSELTQSGRIKLLCSWEVPAEANEPPKRRVVFFQATARRHRH